ncbi:hypothetical protein DTO166G4_9207 [Paecilomyces variotii]|nr:hypothetical protein DTO166G4_9207 [Paecilomyces variotii]KAJ9223122.1 hypothetical protein DTO169C6_4596 [Paecilomyces variotii]KAJ9232678.1 hypothetical protein DTO166G5_6071 [Paecilomyces variotii]KAJ9246854.1 hypothetical protein DTO207G8_8529 [Paecilomyces variotii]KAJ9265022.1 hypothetical protein DTO195F2_2034 [Paecilomyces variotii]
MQSFHIDFCEPPVLPMDSARTANPAQISSASLLVQRPSDLFLLVPTSYDLSDIVPGVCRPRSRHRPG